jgi:hypothetical protein
MTARVVQAPTTRITLLDAAGVGQVRWTLQVPEREGRLVRWVPEGMLRQLGSATGFLRRWIHRGFRLELSLRWGYGLTSTRETWDGTAWTGATVRPTAEAHSEILDWSARLPVQVEPYTGEVDAVFQAIATEKGPSLQDTKGIAHPRLELILAAVVLVGGLTFPPPHPDPSGLGWGLGPWGTLSWGD